jgi:hypothetical protein
MKASMSATQPTEVVPRPRTISVIDEDELQIHKLYRERIVQEDGLINHRMTWMILSQAFLLATFGAIAQKIFGQHPEKLFTEARIVCVAGVIFALGSKFAIRAAQDEIEGLRDRYLEMYPVPNEQEVIQRSEGWFANALDLRWRPRVRVYPQAFKLRKEGAQGEIDQKGAALLPGLTGSRHFHSLGHLLPKAMPLALIILWCTLFLNVKRDFWYRFGEHWVFVVVVVAAILGVALARRLFRPASVRT